MKGVLVTKKNISADYTLNNPNKQTIIPLIRNKNTKILPIFISGKKFLDFNEESNYRNALDKLVERLYNFDVKQKPPLGKSINAVDAYDWMATKNLSELNKYQNHANKGSISYDFKITTVSIKLELEIIVLTLSGANVEQIQFMLILIKLKQ